jgi:hypothetical protein
MVTKPWYVKKQLKSFVRTKKSGVLGTPTSPSSASASIPAVTPSEGHTLTHTMPRVDGPY